MNEEDGSEMIAVDVATQLPRLAWEIERYEVTTPSKETKVILESVSGACETEEMKMILGPSGSGKTSLLSICAGHVPRGRWTGTVWDDGRDAGRSPRRKCGFMVQHSLFFWNLTARETLSYQAWLRQPQSTTTAINEKVEGVLGDLDLLGAAETYCGDEAHKGLSGGELRRLTMAQELLADPSTLLADEPTSGLDASTALLTVAALRRICRQNKAVVAVIHQPRASIVALFDALIVLSGGKLAYTGPPGRPLEAYLENLGLPLPAYENPGDFLLDLIAVSDKTVQSDSRRGDSTKDLLVDRLRDRDTVVAAYPDSDGFRSTRDRIDKCKSSSDGGGGVETAPLVAEATWPFQFRLLLARAVKYKTRDDMVTLTQICMASGFAVIIGAIFYDQGKSTESIQNRVGAISFSVLLMAFLCFDIVILFPRERNLYRREARAGLHTASAFFTARCAAELPGHMVAGLLYSVISYFMMGFQRDSTKFLIYLCIIEVELFTGTSVLIACGCLARDFAGANNLATALLSLFLLLDGHYINNKEIPAGARWLKQLNYLNQGITALARNELSGLGDLRCSDSDRNDDGTCDPFASGGEALDYYGFDRGSFVEQLWKLIVIGFVWRCIALAGFKYLFVD